MARMTRLYYFCLLTMHPYISFSFFFFNDTATTEIYTLSLHDALPILELVLPALARVAAAALAGGRRRARGADRKSTRLNSSHSQISYAVFCLKKKKKVARLVSHPQRSDYQLAACRTA